MGRCGLLAFVYPLCESIEIGADRTIVVTTYFAVIISDDRRLPPVIVRRSANAGRRHFCGMKLRCNGTRLAVRANGGRGSETMARSWTALARQPYYTRAGCIAHKKHRVLWAIGPYRRVFHRIGAKKGLRCGGRGPGETDVCRDSLQRPTPVERCGPHVASCIS